MPTLRRLLCACLILLAAAAAADPILIHYPRAESIDDERGEYGLALLELALAKSGGLYRVELSPTRMQQNRALVELQSGSGRIDIVGTMTSAEREAALLPVRIPMTRGLIGWRIGLVRGDHKDLLRDVRTVEDLKRFSTAQGHDWPDLEILRHSGLHVHPVAVYSGLFGMLNAGRIDWAPRSTNEIWAEAARHPELAIDSHIVLRYPTADYFFVNRNNPALAEAVRTGLEAALADGSFEQLFYLHYGRLLRNARFDQRLIIQLPNPLLSPQTPLGRKELWFSLEDLKRYP
ncbi:substrate-binding periplasmic protein [Duganella violaceipulchra]|uniref:ABC-type amino acid transport substrate-binding protein n=1 Tax=Duganella violaceipulchra TaxID=2849652 RepID=A0ABT1GCH6_9BURK|nr:transporter substrate-binding domain-containing protein [Duganella violaceicalia]MCP2006403.1 ABC-type amino acid transport substrate-binding protein [Duganella violaceicalia]